MRMKVLRRNHHNHHNHHNLLAYYMLAFPLLLLLSLSLLLLSLPSSSSSCGKLVEGRTIGSTLTHRWRSTPGVHTDASDEGQDKGQGKGQGKGKGRPAFSFVRKLQALKIRGGSSDAIRTTATSASVTSSATSSASATASASASASATAKSKTLCKTYAKIGLIDLASPLNNAISDSKSESCGADADADADSQEGSVSASVSSSNDTINNNINNVITIPPITTSSSSTTTTSTTTVSRSAVTCLLHKWIQQHLGTITDMDTDMTMNMDIATVCAVPISSKNYNEEYNQNQNQKIFHIQHGKWILIGIDKDDDGGKDDNGGNDGGNDNNNDSDSDKFTLKKEICAIVETMGCLLDSIIILYDDKFEYRHSAIVSLLKGVQRKQRLRKKSDNVNGSDAAAADTDSGSGSGSGTAVDLIFLANSERARIELDGMKDVLMDDSYGPVGSIYIMPVPITINNDNVSGGGDNNNNNNNNNVIMNNEVVIGKFVQDIMDKVSTIDDDDSKVVESTVHMDAFRKLVQNVYLRLSGKKKKKNGGENTKVDLVFNVVQVEEGERQDNQLDSRSDRDGEGVDGHTDTDNLVSMPDDHDDFFKTNRSEDGGKEEIIHVEEKQTIEEEAISLDGTEQGDSPVAKDRAALGSLLSQRSNEIIRKAETLMYELEKEQDEILLDPETKMPILHFGKSANDILSNTFYGFDSKDLLNVVEDEEDSEMLQVKRKETLSIVNNGIHRLFETQLQSLREYYGRRYENILNEMEEKNTKNLSEVDGDKLKEIREKQNVILTEAAKRSTEGFRVAAQNAIPVMLRKELKDLGELYGFDSVLDGLIRDMMHATSSSQILEEEWASVNAIDDGDTDDTSTETKKRRRGPIRWYEKLAARALVLGVNYLQGWLAWQGIRKAAAERDKKMPKFPLF